MLGRAMGQLVAGALWGVGAAVAMKIAQEGPENLSENLRDLTRDVVRNALDAVERADELKAEVVQSFESAVAEARAERQSRSTDNAGQ